MSLRDANQDIVQPDVVSACECVLVDSAPKPSVLTSSTFQCIPRVFECFVLNAMNNEAAHSLSLSLSETDNLKYQIHILVAQKDTCNFTDVIAYLASTQQLLCDTSVIATCSFISSFAAHPSALCLWALQEKGPISAFWWEHSQKQNHLHVSEHLSEHLQHASLCSAAFQSLHTK